MRFSKEQARLRAIMTHRDRWIIWSRAHARIRLGERGVTETDVIRVLTYGIVTWFEIKVDEIVHVEGRDASNRKLRVIAALRDHVNTVKVITVFEVGQGRR
jgi:hypothetical protein